MLHSKFYTVKACAEIALQHPLMTEEQINQIALYAEHHDIVMREGIHAGERFYREHLLDLQEELFVCEECGRQIAWIDVSREQIDWGMDENENEVYEPIFVCDNCAYDTADIADDWNAE